MENRSLLRDALLGLGGVGANKDRGIPWSGRLAPRRVIAKSGRQAYDASYRKEPFSISAERLARRRARQREELARLQVAHRWPW